MRALGMAHESSNPVRFDRRFFPPSLVFLSLALLIWIPFLILPSHPGERDLGLGVVAVATFIGSGIFLLCGLLTLLVALAMFLWNKWRAHLN